MGVDASYVMPYRAGLLALIDDELARSQFMGDPSYVGARLYRPGAQGGFPADMPPLSKYSYVDETDQGEVATRYDADQASDAGVKLREGDPLCITFHVVNVDRDFLVGPHECTSSTSMARVMLYPAFAMLEVDEGRRLHGNKELHARNSAYFASLLQRLDSTWDAPRVVVCPDDCGNALMYGVNRQGITMTFDEALAQEVPRAALLKPNEARRVLALTGRGGGAPEHTKNVCPELAIHRGDAETLEAYVDASSSSSADAIVELLDLAVRVRNTTCVAVLMKSPAVRAKSTLDKLHAMLRFAIDHDDVPTVATLLTGGIITPCHDDVYAAAHASRRMFDTVVARLSL